MSLVSGKRKRQTSAEAARTVAVIDAASGVTSIVTALQSLSPMSYSAVWQRRLAHDELYAIPNTLTPYGAVCCEDTIRGASGDLKIFHVNPFALLAFACDHHTHFRSFFASIVASSRDNLLDIIYYMDKATPGNNKRPDNGRAAQCIYFSFLQFPAWFRSRRNGWIPFAYVLVADQKEASVHDSALTRFLVRTFDSESSEVDFSKGFGVTGPGGTVTIVRARRHLTIADWDQHVRTFNLKGYNARVPCGMCKNVLGRCKFFQDPYLVHLHSSEYEKFDKHTPESYEELADGVKRLVETEPNKLLKHERNTGIKWHVEGVLWDVEVRRKLQSPMCQYPDWMHGVCASGGIAQYELNGLALQLDEQGISLQDIDLWISTVRKPKGMAPIAKKFFQARIVRGAKKHVRAFASEVLSAITFLGFFIDAVVQTLPVLRDVLSRHLACFDLLRVMLAILQKGDLKDLATLRNATQMHHTLYRTLYHCIPKLHNQGHVADFWEFWEALLSCFGPERHHRFFKRVMSFSYRQSSRTVLAYDVRTWIKNLGQEQLFMPIHLLGKQHQMAVDIFLTSSGLSVTFTAVSSGVNTEMGQLCKGDLVQYVRVDGAQLVGFALGFGRTASPTPFDYAAFVHPCVPVSPTTWRRQSHDVNIIWLSAVVGSCPFVVLDCGGVAPLLHSEA